MYGMEIQTSLKSSWVTGCGPSFLLFLDFLVEVDLN